MKKQKKEAEQRIKSGKGPRWENDGNVCFLCDNIGQAIASNITTNVPNNMMYDRGNYIILPNKYPAFIGHSLLIPKKHDDETGRVKPLEGKYLPEQGKTRGALVTPEFLEETVSTCEDLGLVGIRNHALDGMSIPGHDHFHLYPRNLKFFSLTERIIQNSMKTDYGEKIYSPRNTPFDMLVFSSRNMPQKDGFYEKTSNVLIKMEKTNQVFTLFYEDGNLTVCPRKNPEKITSNLKVGGGMCFHSLDSEDKEYLDKIRTWVPMKGEFNWGEYF